MDDFDPELERIFDKKKRGEPLTAPEEQALKALLATADGKEQWADLERIRDAFRPAAAPLPPDFAKGVLGKLGPREGIDTPSKVIRPPAGFWTKAQAWAPIALAAGLLLGYFGRPLVLGDNGRIGADHPEKPLLCKAIGAEQQGTAYVLEDVDADFTREVTIQRKETNRGMPLGWEALMKGKLCKAHLPLGGCKTWEEGVFNVVYQCEVSPADH